MLEDRGPMAIYMLDRTILIEVSRLEYLDWKRFTWKRFMWNQILVGSSRKQRDYSTAYFSEKFSVSSRKNSPCDFSMISSIKRARSQPGERVPPAKDYAFRLSGKRETFSQKGSRMSEFWWNCKECSKEMLQRDASR